MNRVACLRFFAICTIVIGLEGCASFNKEEMVVFDYDSNNPHPYSLSIDVGAGNEKSDVGLIPVPRKDLLFAIEKSIRNGHVFESVVFSGEDGDYLLNVSVFSLEQPVMGFNMTVKIEAGWTLKKADGNVVWQKLIKSEYTLGVSDAFVGQTRLRMANDGAIRENIRQGMIQIAGLNI